MKHFGSFCVAACMVFLCARMPVEGQSVRVDLDLVLVTASVVDAQGRPVTGLDVDDFTIWEDGVQQEIEHFSTEFGAASVGIALDVSNSMEETVTLARDAAAQFLQAGTARDEYFLLEFDDRPRITQDFTGDVTQLLNRLVAHVPDGNTALYDAVYLGVSRLRDGPNPRKALLVVTDGEDNRSRYTLRDIREILRESDVQVYAIGLSATLGRETLSGLTQITGGRAEFTNDSRELEEISRRLAMEMQSQYVLGYVSSNASHSGEWRKLRVRVAPQPDSGPVAVRSKQGYYAASF